MSMIPRQRDFTENPDNTIKNLRRQLDKKVAEIRRTRRALQGMYDWFSGMADSDLTIEAKKAVEKARKILKEAKP